MISIKRATLKDVNDVQMLNQELFHHDFQFDKTLNVKWPTKNKKYYSGNIKSKNSIVLIAKEGVKSIGYLIGSIMKVEDWRSVGKMAELENMFVSDEYRGQGIGTRMIQEFFSWARKNKVKRLHVVASASNAGAINAYLKNGFKPYNNVMEMSL